MSEFAKIAKGLGSENIDIADVAQMLELPNNKGIIPQGDQQGSGQQSKVKQINKMLGTWDTESDSLEPRRVLARKLSKLGKEVCLKENNKKECEKTKERFEAMAKELDIYYTMIADN